MSGIVGVWQLDGAPVERDSLGRMLKTIGHRGSGVSRTETIEGFGLGNQLISETAKFPSPMPLVCPETGRLVVADARLDNATELGEILALPREILQGDRDRLCAWVILASYEKWGKECPERLRGDFVFAIADPERRKLFLARDPFGARPLVYFHDPGHLFAFASEAKALFDYPGIPKEPHLPRFADFLVPQLETLDFESTFFERLYRFPPGSCLEFAAEMATVKPRRWFHLDPDAEELRLRSDQEYEEVFLDEFRGAVGRCLGRVGPVGSMLSGGLDSSSIVAVAQEILREQGKGSLPTFSAVSVEDPEGPETTAIREVIRHTGVKGREIVPDEMAELGVETDEAIRHSDDPFDLLITLVPAAFSAASMEGCRTIMTGVDGDVCSGVSRRYLIYQFRSGNLISPWIEAAGLAFTSGDGWRYAADLLRFSILSAFRPEKTRENHREGWTRRILDSSPLSTEFAERIGLEERVAALYERELPWPEPPSLTHRHVHSLQSPIMTAALERYDRNAHRFSIELAHPFLDRRFVEFSLRLPIRQRARFGWSKWVLRKTTEGLLPRSARWRRENMTVNPEFARRGLVNGLGSGAFSSGALGGIQSLVSDEVFARATGAEAPSPTDYEGLFVSRTCRFLGRWRETRFPNRES